MSSPSQVRLILVSLHTVQHDLDTSSYNTTKTSVIDENLLKKLKMKLLETKRTITAKPFIPFNTRVKDTFEISSSGNIYPCHIVSPFDVKISYSNEYILVSDPKYSWSRSWTIKVFDLTTRLYLKTIDTSCKHPPYICVEERPFLEDSGHSSDALIFTQALSEGELEQGLYKFNLKQLVEKEDGQKKPIWFVDVGKQHVGSMTTFDHRLYVVLHHVTIQMFNSKTGESLATIFGDPSPQSSIADQPQLFGLEVNVHTRELMACNRAQLLFFSLDQHSKGLERETPKTYISGDSFSYSQWCFYDRASKNILLGGRCFQKDIQVIHAESMTSIAKVNVGHSWISDTMKGMCVNERTGELLLIEGTQILVIAGNNDSTEPPQKQLVPIAQQDFYRTFMEYSSSRQVLESRTVITDQNSEETNCSNVSTNSSSYLNLCIVL
ncbi:hypothetical protein C9374_008828 [Naegleria lovaniensis]|uniref:Uncharacterized protein n=1 Tax=Naegleria lovaniensis TaxID=51637 RepID=A0AA88KHE6_NAELO|nr:uncharacterized protein C9374_008828 [Naegleria lovaniensis]KAG2377743.1 hypothetical protein C9374_008828 [Naegleria lovaniensis]